MARLRGTSGADILEGTDWSDQIYGRGGSDIIHTGGGSDYAYGGGGQDTIIAGDGWNYVYGGSGADTFGFEEGSSGSTILHDWQDGTDVMDLSDLGVTGFAELSVVDMGYWTQVNAMDATIWIKSSLLSGDLREDDFVFAAPPEPDPQPEPDPEPDPGTDGGTTTADGETLFEFNGLGFWSRPGSTGEGDFVAKFVGWFGANSNAVDGTSGNGFIYPEYNDSFGGWGPATISANTDVMANDTFDLEAFKTSDSGGFTLIAFNDGVETGRQTFDGVAAPWTEIRPDDAIFDAVDEVQFVGFSALDDLLIIA